MKHFNFWALALTAIIVASCTSEDDLTLSPPANQAEEETMAPILFTSSQSAFTRADFTGAEAAEKLGNQFVVFGYKGSSTGTPGSTVFDNYLVKYQENTANTTESNTKNWEYVGLTPIKHATDNGITQQTIKYWDYTKDQYDFIAWSTGSKEAIYSGTPAAGTQVLVSEIAATAAASPSTGLTNAYTFTGTAADLSECYISDLVTVKKSSTTAGNKYGDPVTLKFRQLGTKVRIGIYETIPGYSVRNVKFYPQAGALSNASQITDEAKLFTTTANDIKTAGTYTVYFPTVDDESASDNNLAHVKFVGTGDQTTIVNYGAMNYSAAEDAEKTPGIVYLGRTSNTATYAGTAASNYYTVFLPNESGTNLNLRVDYTLESIDGSGEVINVKNASAQVPLIYTTWKPGYAYTYLFKISDKTNGWTGVYDPTKPDNDPYNSDPVGLYPITFDAVVVNAEDDATQETITLVSTPSITTYQKGSKVVANDEYLAAGEDIFVTVSENNNLVVLSATNSALYKLNKVKTEAEVIDALTYQDDDNAVGTIKGRNGLVLTTQSPSLVTEIQYGADGNVIKLDDTDTKAMQFDPAAGTYAFVYIKTDPSSITTNDIYEAKPFTVGTAVKGYYRYAYGSVTAGDVQKDEVYFETETSGMKTVFLGQTVDNLYTRSGAAAPYTYTQASGYAVTANDYYYYMNGKYNPAHRVTYAAGVSGLYEVKNGAYTLTEDTQLVNGKAYYYKNSDNEYEYCVFYPEQALATWKKLDTASKVACGETENAVDGMTYFDKYTKNNAERYVKVIKVE